MEFSQVLATPHRTIAILSFQAKQADTEFFLSFIKSLKIIAAPPVSKMEKLFPGPYGVYYCDIAIAAPHSVRHTIQGPKKCKCGDGLAGTHWTLSRPQHRALVKAALGPETIPRNQSDIIAVSQKFSRGVLVLITYSSVYGGLTVAGPSDVAIGIINQNTGTWGGAANHPLQSWEPL